MEDHEIIELFFARSEDAIAALARKYGTASKKLAQGILNDREDAEECVNDAYLGVWNTIPPRRPKPLLTYLCAIVRNQALKKYHSKTAAKRNSTYDVALSELEHCFPSSDSVEEAFDAAETARCVNAFLKALDRESRILFVRRYWYAESVGDLAVLFRTNRHTISLRLFRIREKLKKHLRKEGIVI
ncbi:MAG: sigma-70 family RNA polymerase sigma factor [Oscillospiraceae bacterium]|nr:sigma-70 family RNA polymerase sigma factor [Oscillospiraceae bacterium]